MEFPIKDFAGKIDEAIGGRIEVLQALVKNGKKGNVPLLFWLKLTNQKWYRFFIDAWMLHWVEYKGDERVELMKEDFEDDIISYKVRDLTSEFSLKDKLIEDAEMKYLEELPLFTGQLKIKVEGNLEIIINDFGDKKEEQLIIQHTGPTLL